MKITQFYEQGSIRLGLVHGQMLTPLNFEGGLVEFIKSEGEYHQAQDQRPLVQVRMAPVISNPMKIIAIGLNYHDHVQESKGTVPERPLIFAKFQNTLIGPHEIRCAIAPCMFCPQIRYPRVWSWTVC